jgi:hypothetical protein
MDRNSGAFDGVIDFDAVVRDPRMVPSYEKGDNLHPSDAGAAETGARRWRSRSISKS